MIPELERECLLHGGSKLVLVLTPAHRGLRSEVPAIR